MDAAIVEAKISNMTDPRDSWALSLMREIQAAARHDDASWMRIGQGMLTRILARIASEEGLDSKGNPYDEEILKDYIPDTMANAITALAEILFAKSVVRPKAEVALGLLLKLYEWSVWNYDGRSVYGEKIEQEARRIFDSMDPGVVVYGNKEEVWNGLDEILLDTFDMQGHVLCRAPVLGYRTYSEEIEMVCPEIWCSERFWVGHLSPVSLILKTAASTRTVDQTEVRLSCHGLASNRDLIESKRKIESIILHKLVEMCGEGKQDWHTWL